MGRRSTMLAVLIGMYFFSYYYRISPAVIAPYLTHEFSLGAERLGLLASIFFYVFAFAQFPLGPALDSIGPRRVISALSAIGALGSLIFALAPSFTICLFGRALLGLGMSCMYMGNLMVVAIWYPPRLFATLTGLVSALGNTGALTAAVPLALLAESVGWRTSFLIFAGINSLLALSIWLTVRDHPPRQGNDAPPAPQKYAASQAYRRILSTPSFWGIAVMLFFTTGSFFSIQSLWAGTFLMDVFGMRPREVGWLISCLTAGFIVGSLLTGKISDHWRISRKRQALITMGLYLVPLLLIATTLRQGRESLLYPVYFATGFFASGGVLIVAHLKELFPRQIVGTALALGNFFAVIGIATLQYLMGWLIERHPAVGGVYPAEAYRDAFFLLFAGMAAALIFYSRAREITLFKQGSSDET
ncbi:MAG: MFS transporter [Thermodesulfobacteriota bacterium]|jgi:predicted MFS family arabinose efflux permease